MAEYRNYSGRELDDLSPDIESRLNKNVWRRNIPVIK